MKPKKNTKLKSSDLSKPEKVILDRHRQKITAEEAMQFLENIRTMTSEINQPTVAISLRVPKNILTAVKLKAKADGKKYQSLIIEYIRNQVRSK